jgi:hypothetical protein
LLGGSIGLANPETEKILGQDEEEEEESEGEGHIQVLEEGVKVEEDSAIGQALEEEKLLDELSDEEGRAQQTLKAPRGNKGKGSAMDYDATDATRGTVNDLYIPYSSEGQGQMYDLAKREQSLEAKRRIDALSDPKHGWGPATRSVAASLGVPQLENPTPSGSPMKKIKREY